MKRIVLLVMGCLLFSIAPIGCYLSIGTGSTDTETYPDADTDIDTDSDTDLDTDADTDTDTGSDTDTVTDTGTETGIDTDSGSDDDSQWNPSSLSRMGVDTDGLFILAGRTLLGTNKAYWCNEEGVEQFSVPMNGRIDDFIVSPTGGFVATERIGFYPDPETFSIFGYTRDGERWSIPLPDVVFFIEDGEGYDCKGYYATAMNNGLGDTFVVAGAFSYELVLGEGQENEITLGAPDAYAMNTFIARYTMDGVLEWATETDFKLVPEALTIADDGTMFVYGRHSSYESRITVAFDSEGKALWVNDQDIYFTPPQFPATTRAYAHISDDGSYYVIGNFRYNIILADRFGTEIELFAPVHIDGSSMATSNGYFISRYSSDGELLWAQNTYEGEYDNRVSILASGAFLMNGHDLVIPGSSLRGSVTFGSGEPNETTIDSPGQFIASYLPDGTLKWLKYFQDTDVSFAAGVQTGTNQMLFAGVFSGELTLEDGSTITSYNEDGDFLLLKQTEL